MDKPSAKPLSGWKELGRVILWYALFCAVLLVPVLIVLSGVRLIVRQPEVGARPGVRTMVGPDDHTRVTDCGGSSLHIVRHGARVGAELTERARAAEAACRRGAWNSVVVAVVLFLLALPCQYRLIKLLERYDQ